MVKLKPGLYMIATIAVIAAIAEKKKTSAIAAIIAIIWKPLSSHPSDNGRWDIKSSMSVIVVVAIAGEWFPYDRWTFFLSDRSDHMETGLNLSQ